MGDCKTMKLSILTVLIISSLVNANNESINTPMTVPATGNVTVLQSGNDKELMWVDEQIKAILPARIGVTDSFINSLLDPIKYVQPKRTLGATNGLGGYSGQSTLLSPPKLSTTAPIIVAPKVVVEPLRLKALMNKSALIGLKWYRVGDSVREYTLAEIRSNSVLLNGSKGSSFVLFLSKNNNNIQLNTK